MDACIVIATYNEAATIRQIIEAVDWPVIVVDDSSPDNTGLIARSAGAMVITRPAKSGIASAYFNGFRAALDSRAEFIVQMDAGLTHNPVDVALLLATAQDGYDLVIGSRQFGWGYRAMISRSAAVLMRANGIKMPDVTSGFRCWRRSLLQRVASKPFKASGFAFQLEAIHRAKGAKMAAIPIEYKLTNSTFRPQMLMEALKIWATLD